MRRVQPLILVSLMLAACSFGQTSTPEIELSETFALGTPFWIGMDQTASQRDGSLRLTFLDVPEDGRCPVGTNINCATAGQVTVLLQAAHGDREEEVPLTIPPARVGVSRVELFDLYTIELLAVEPQRTSVDPMDRSAYRALLIVTEGVATEGPPVPVTAVP